MAERDRVLRVVDANANRVREGLRVIEEYYRFVLDDETVTRRLKSLRHEVTDAVACLADSRGLLLARDTAEDVGIPTTVESEHVRSSIHSVVMAAFKRAEEGLRVLEEYSKVLAVHGAGERFKTLRFELYTLEKELRLSEDE